MLKMICFSTLLLINMDLSVSNVLRITDRTEEKSSSNSEIVQIWYPKTAKSLEIKNSFFTTNFFAFGKNITVNLEPIEFELIGERTPVWLGDWTNETFTLKQLPPFTIGEEFKWYATSNNTVMGTGFDNGLVYFIGKVEDLSVIPLSKNESQKLRRRKRDIGNELLPGSQDPTGSFLLSDYHKIYVSSKKDNVDFSDTIKTSFETKAEMENRKFLKRIKRDSSNQQETIRPKIMLYADYGSQFIEARGLLFNRFIMYLISFWNNVNIYFQHLQNPRVSFRITGIIIAMNEPAVPFFIENHVGFAKIVCKESLIDMNLWFNQNQHIISRDTYDIIMTMTNRDLFRSRYFKDYAVNGAVSSSVVCNENQLKINVTAIVHDTKFSGIPAAVEQLAFVINAGYKTSLSSDVNSCKTHDGTVCYVDNSTDTFYFQNMFWLSPHRGLSCNYTKHFLDTGKPLPNILPGEITSLDEQCQILGYEKNCNVHDNFNCDDFLWCEKKQLNRPSYNWSSKTTICYGVHFILDGTLCGKNKYCYNKQCVPYVQEQRIQNVLN